MAFAARESTFWLVCECHSSRNLNDDSCESEADIYWCIELLVLAYRSQVGHALPTCSLSVKGVLSKGSSTSCLFWGIMMDSSFSLPFCVINADIVDSACNSVSLLFRSTRRRNSAC